MGIGRAPSCWGVVSRTAGGRGWGSGRKSPPPRKGESCTGKPTLLTTPRQRSTSARSASVKVKYFRTTSSGISRGNRSCDSLADATRTGTGEGAKLLHMLKEAGVDLLAYSGFPKGRRGQVDFIPADAAAFRAAARKAKVALVGPKSGFLLQGEDRPGALAEVIA